MTSQEASALVASLKAAFPDANIPAETVVMYAAALEDLDFQAGQAAVGALIRSTRWFPKIAEIREAAAEQTLGVPSPASAWERLTEYTDHRREHATLTDLERRALQAVGGTWAVRTSESPTVLRSQFMKVYEELRRDAIRQEMHGPYALPEGRRELAA